MDDLGPLQSQKTHAQVNQLVQGRVRLFALGLIGIDLIYAAAHGEWAGQRRDALEIGLMGLSLASLVALVVLLRRPSSLRAMNAMAALATLLAALATLAHIGREGDLRETTHLMLVLVGAGCFIYSLYWLALVLTVAIGGWASLVWIAHPQGPWAFFSLELLGGALLGLLVHLVQGDLMRMFEGLLVRDQRHEEEQDRLLGELKHSLEGIKTLRGLVPICASCKQIRDDRGFWHQVEAYVHQHTEATFTHGLCPRCAEALRAEFERETKGPDSAP